TTIGSFFDTRLNGGIIVQKVARPLSTGHLELRSTDPNETPKVRFNYFQEPEDLRNCVQGMKTIINVVNSKAFSKFRYRTISTQQLLNVVAALPLNQRPRHFDTASSLEQFCNDTVMTFWHHHGGCQVGKVVDEDYKVIGVDGLRVIDASTFSSTPGTNPQATVMMLGRIVDAFIPHKKGKYDRGFGFIRYAYCVDANKAIERLHYMGLVTAIELKAEAKMVRAGNVELVENEATNNLCPELWIDKSPSSSERVHETNKGAIVQNFSTLLTTFDGVKKKLRSMAEIEDKLNLLV
ncbi:hypothetical protein Goklo_009683, partial [Gossypium klotzschianum]|nr:hypothetical protein [Gossypium klotzschianum]